MLFPADLARELKVSRARMSQVLWILKLVPEVLETPAALGDPLPAPVVTERNLGSVVGLPSAEHKQKVAALLSVARS
jgi:hypothetical protein